MGRSIYHCCTRVFNHLEESHVQHDRPIKFLVYGVAVPVVDAKFAFYHYAAVIHE